MPLCASLRLSVALGGPLRLPGASESENVDFTRIIQQKSMGNFAPSLALLVSGALCRFPLASENENVDFT